MTVSAGVPAGPGGWRGRAGDQPGGHRGRGGGGGGAAPPLHPLHPPRLRGGGRVSVLAGGPSAGGEDGAGHS